MGAETTAIVFGRELHSYVITDAIRDEKVLKFKVDYNDVRTKFQAYFKFAQRKQKEEAKELIQTEELNEEAAKRYIKTSLKREYASENGTELNEVLPKMSPLNPKYLTKKQSVFEKIVAFVEKFKGVGGDI